jgi:hypothetical protein
MAYLYRLTFPDSYGYGPTVEYAIAPSMLKIAEELDKERFAEEPIKVEYLGEYRNYLTKEQEEAHDGVHKKTV